MPVYMPVDQNQGARNSVVRSCLMTAGWQPVKDKEEAALVTNSTRPAPAQAVSGFLGWNAAKAACRTQADTAANYANAFDECMKTHGW